MKKKHILQALASFDDEDDVAIGDVVYLGTVCRICGKRQYGMSYICVLAPGHKGRCYCSCKNVFFDPDNTAAWQTKGD